MMVRARLGATVLVLGLSIVSVAVAGECRSTGAALDFGLYPIGSRVAAPRFPARQEARCRREGECPVTDPAGVAYDAAYYPGEAAVIERKSLSGRALDAYGARFYGWRRGDTVATVQAKFKRATGKTLEGGVNDTGEILLFDVCARNGFGEYQFYASFGKTGRLAELITRIDTPSD